MSLTRVVSVSLIGLAAILLLLVAFALYWPGPAISFFQSTTDEAVFYFDTDEPIVALTFDDGPDPVATPAILDELKKHGATATFFVIGGRIPGNEAILRRMVDEGHELGNHGMREEPAIELSPEAFEATVDSAQVVLATFDTTRWYRPGSGFFDGPMLQAVNERGLKMVVGSVYPFDTVIESPEFAASFILRNIRPGSVVVLHENGANGERAVQTLRIILPELRKRGYRVGSLSSVADT